MIARSRRKGRRRKAARKAAIASDGDDAGQQAVAVLDRAVGVELGLDERAVALRPGRAAQARAGQAHGGAGEDDQRQDHER